MTVSYDMSSAVHEGRRLAFVPYALSNTGIPMAPEGWRTFCTGCALDGCLMCYQRLDVTLCRTGCGGRKVSGWWKEVPQ